MLKKEVMLPGMQGMIAGAAVQGNLAGELTDLQETRSHLKICKCCQTPFRPNHPLQEYCSDDCKKTGKRMRALRSYHKNHARKKKEREEKRDGIGYTQNTLPKCSLCESCRHVVPNPTTGAGCSWSRAFIPVNGWEAVKETKGNYESYKVIRCPRFVKGVR